MIYPKNLLIRHALFHCELFPWLIFLAEIFNYMLMLKKQASASLLGWPLARYQLNGLILPDISYFYLKVSFRQYLILCSLSRNILHKLAAP